MKRGVQVAASLAPHPAFTLTVDYLAFTLPSSSVEGVINRIGGEWSKCSGGYRGYPKSWIWNANSGIAHLGTGASRNPLEVNVDLSGGIVSAWPVEKTHGVLAWIFHLQGHLTRIDLALDDRQAAVPVDQIREAIEVGPAHNQSQKLRLDKSSPYGNRIVARDNDKHWQRRE